MDQNGKRYDPLLIIRAFADGLLPTLQRFGIIAGLSILLSGVTYTFIEWPIEFLRKRLK